MQITLTDLRDIKTWAADDGSTDFLDKLIFQVEDVVRRTSSSGHGQWDEGAESGEVVAGGVVGEETIHATPISCKDFVLAFARCLGYEDHEGVHTCMHAHMHTYAHTHIHTHIRTHIHTCRYEDHEGVAEVLEKRASEYRRIGKLFGMEKVQPTFQWSKFWLSFAATGLAFVTYPLASLMHRVNTHVMTADFAC